MIMKKYNLNFEKNLNISWLKNGKKKFHTLR